MNASIQASKKVISRQQVPESSFIYKIISHLIVFPIYKILFRGTTSGIENVPTQGSCIVVANHGSHIDPPLLGHVLRRPVAFMAKAELFSVPLIGRVIRACGAYPVKRGASDREAIRSATKRLDEGWAIGVFPDGTRQEDGRMNLPMPGAALLAARSDSVLLPVAIINSHRALGTGQRFPRVLPIHVRIGKPIQPPTSRRKEDLMETMKEIQRQINSLLDKGLIDSMC